MTNAQLALYAAANLAAFMVAGISLALAVLYAIRWYDKSIGLFSMDDPWLKVVYRNKLRPLRTFIMEVFHVFIHIFMFAGGALRWLAGWRNGYSPGKGYAKKGAPMVVLVHGLMMFPANMWLIKFKLRIRGIRNVAAFDYRSTTGPIEKQRDYLRDFLIKVFEESGAEGYVLVGHSMGGLIAHEYACEYEGQHGGLLALVTLGTPFRGSRISSLGITRAAMGLHPSNPYFLKAVSRRPQAPFVNILAEYDQLVIPYTNASHPLADETVELDSCGHSGLLYDGGAFEHMMKPLRKALASVETQEQPPAQVDALKG